MLTIIVGCYYADPLTPKKYKSISLFATLIFDIVSTLFIIQPTKLFL